MQIGADLLTLNDFSKVLYQEETISVSPIVINTCLLNFSFLKQFSAHKVVYGINTGLGPMAQHKIPYADRLVLQYNLIRSHASGSGAPIARLYSRAMLIDRLNTFARCKSGVHPDLLMLLAEMINQNVIPVIYEHGGVGASGDLVQLAHMALAIIGEGECYENDDDASKKAVSIKSAKDALREKDLTPFAIRLREGLAMMNGTSCMTGIGLINLIEARKLLSWSILISATINELFEAFDDHISAELNRSKCHVGQNKIAEVMRHILNVSTMMRDRSRDLLSGEGEVPIQNKVQEYYSLRCMPQILGPVYDTLSQSEVILVAELNSVSDNPIVDHESGNVYHGGNFHGDYVALEMDKMKIAVTKMSMLADRQLNYLLNDKLNGKLPPFINTLTKGLNFGLQGVQYSSTSTVAENQTLSNPMYIHSIPSNNDNQDIVSMGTNAALMTARVIENTYEVLAVEVLALVEAIDCLDKAEQLSAKPKELYNGTRQICRKIGEDLPRFHDLALLKSYLKTHNPHIL